MATKKKAKTEKKVSTSSRIRTLHAEGKGPTEISKELGIRYQHAYNVIKRDKDKAELEAYRANQEK